MPVSIFLFVTLWGLILAYHRFFEESINLRLGTELDNRIESFLKKLIEKYVIIEEKKAEEEGQVNYEPTLNTDNPEYETIRGEFRDLLFKSKKVFKAQGRVQRINFIRNKLRFLIFILLPAVVVFVIKNISVFTSQNENLKLKISSLVSILGKLDSIAQAILMLVLIFFMLDFFGVYTIKYKL